MSTALIILNYNNYEDTVNCIESVEKYNSAPIKYIVVDNGSTKEGLTVSLDEYFRKRFSDSYVPFNYEEDSVPDRLPYMSFVISKTNDGYACGNNKGLKYAYADETIDKVMILNNDILFIQDIIPQLSKFVEEKEDCAIMSPLLLKKNQIDIDYNCARLAPTFEQIIIPYFLFYQDIFGLITRTRAKVQLLKHSPEKVQEDCIQIELPSGSCMMIKKSLMQEIGGFDPHTFLFYEENILYKKFLQIGKMSYMIPNLKCIHLGASTTNQNVSLQTQYASMNSSRYYLEKHCSLTSLQRILMEWSYFNMRMKIKLKNLLKKMTKCA